MSMGTSLTRRVETDALIMAVGCRRKRQRMRQQKYWTWAKGQTEHIKGFVLVEFQVGHQQDTARRRVQKPWHVQEDIGCGSGSERSTLHGTNVEIYIYIYIYMMMMMIILF